MDTLVNRKDKLDSKVKLTRASSLRDRLSIREEVALTTKRPLTTEVKAEPQQPEVSELPEKETPCETKPIASALDSQIDSLKKRVSFYVNNQEELYQVYCGFSSISHTVTLLWNLTVIAQNEINFSSFLNGTGFWILSALGFHAVMIALGFAIKSRIQNQNPRGLSLMAIHLSLQLMSLSLFSIVIGLYAVLNATFRKRANSWAPTWVQALSN